MVKVKRLTRKTSARKTVRKTVVCKVAKRKVLPGFHGDIVINEAFIKSFSDKAVNGITELKKTIKKGERPTKPQMAILKEVIVKLDDIANMGRIAMEAKRIKNCKAYILNICKFSALLSAFIR